MNLSELSVRRGVTFAMLFLILVGFGLFSFTRLKVDLYPDLTFPLIVVITTYEGVGPEEIETLITRPIEEAVVAVKGVKEVNSTSKQGISLVMAEFDWGDDLDQAETNILRRLELIEMALPPDAEKPMTIAFDPSMQPVLMMSLSGPYDAATLRQVSEREVEPYLERVEGVASATTGGGLKREIQIQMDPDRLETMQIAPAQIVAALRSSNMDIPGGSIYEGEREYALRIRGEYTSIDQISNTVVGMSGYNPVRVSDVAVVADTFAEQTRVIQNNGKDSVMMIISKQSDANTVTAVRGVMAALPEVEKRLPEGMKFSIMFNQEEFISESISNLSSTAIQGFFITILVLFLFLGRVRPSLIVGAAIPVSVLATFGVMDQMGLTLNIISMTGLALAIGMLVDNSIVVQENITRYTELGYDPRKSAVLGAREVGMALTASTLTTIAVFVPVLFVPGIAGVMFQDMAVTICFSLLVSLLVAISLVPLLSSRFMGKKKVGLFTRLFRKKKYQEALQQQRAASVGKGIGLSDGEVITEVESHDMMLTSTKGTWGKIYAWYRNVLASCLKRPKTVVAVVIVLFIFSLGAFPAGLLVTEFFPKSDSSQITLELDAGVGTNLQSAMAIGEEARKIVSAEVPEAYSVTLDLGTGEGFTAIMSKGSHAGSLRIKLVPPAERKRSQQDIEVALMKRLSQLPGLKVSLGQEMGMGSGADIEIELIGHDLDAARTLGLDLQGKLKQINNVADVTFSMEAQLPQYELNVDRDKANAMGLSVGSISSAVSTAVLGTVATRYREGEDEYDIRVRLDRESRESSDVVGRIPIITPTGAVVPVRSIATVEPAMGPVNITRNDQRRLVTLSITVAGHDLGGVVKQVTSVMDGTKMPPGFQYRLGGAAEDFQESFKYLAIAMLVAVLLVFMVMASQFENLVSPFIILFTVPMAFIGVVAILIATNTSLSVIALVGVVMLVGIVVNNGIVMVDYFNQLRPHKKSLLETVIEGSVVRLRPVLMTAATTVLSMIPLAIELGEGSEAWAPMAKTVIGGLSSATFITLLFVPALYLLVIGRRERRQRRRAARLATAVRI